MARTFHAAIVCSMLAAACAPSVNEINQARGAGYQTDYSAVWKVVQEEMHDRFRDRIKMEDGTAGVIVSDWKLVSVDQEASEGDTYTPRDQMANTVSNGVFYRMRVRVVPGGPPWRIDVDAEAAAYRPDMSMLIPFKHGDPYEPVLVSGRINSFHIAIYHKLKPFAVQPQTGTMPAPVLPTDSPPAPVQPDPAQPAQPAQPADPAAGTTGPGR